MSAHDNADSQAVKMEKNGDSRTSSRSPLRSPLPKKKESPGSQSDASDMKEEKLDEMHLKQEPGQRPRLSRSSSQKVSRPPPLYTHLPDSTQDALATFEQINGCSYANKYMGYTEHAMECDCAEEWGK